MHQNNAFITLTYSDPNLPTDSSLYHPDYQNFMKRLRIRNTPKNPFDKLIKPVANENHRIRHQIGFYMCGEYSPKLDRPHYHAILFNKDFSDKRFFKMTKAGEKIYTSRQLQDVWATGPKDYRQPIGHAYVGAVSFKSAAYVARYIMKKRTGEAAIEHYRPVDPETGEWRQLEPEYNEMSRYHGIGKTWFLKHWREVYPSDTIIINGKPMRPPVYYDKLLYELHPKLLEIVKDRRLEQSLDPENVLENTPKRLKTREQHHLARQSRFLRE